MEITQEYVRKIVKELTIRALRKRIESLDYEKIKKLEDKLNNLSDADKIRQFEGSGKDISDLISQEGINEKGFIKSADKLFETKIHHWIKLPAGIVLPVSAKSIIIIIAIASVAVLALPYLFENHKPLAYINVIEPGSTVYYGTSMTFSGYAGGIDEDEYISAYEWIVDGIAISNSDGFTEILPEGLHSVQFRVMNNRKVWSEPVTIEVEVLHNLKPVAEISPAFTRVTIGTPAIFESSSTDPDEGDYIAEYKWYVDGNLFNTSEQFIETDLPSGNHTIRLSVKDNHDLWSDPASAFLEVLVNRPPTAHIVSVVPGTAVFYGTSVTLSGFGTDPDEGDKIVGYEWQIDSEAAGNESVLTIDNLSLGTHTVRFRVVNNHGVKSEFVEETITVSLEYVKFNVYSEAGLIVENGLCDNGIKNCMKNGTIQGGGYYAKVGDLVALNGNPNVLTNLLLDEQFAAGHILGIGDPIPLQQGFDLVAMSMDVKNQSVWLELIKDGSIMKSSVIRSGEPFTYSANVGGETDVPVIVFSVETVFSGATTDLVEISGIWMISIEV